MTLPRWLRGLIVVAIVVAIGGAVAVYRFEERQLRGRAERELQTIAALKIERITAWRTDILNDAWQISESPFLRAAVALAVADPSNPVVAQLYDRLIVYPEHFGYSDVLLADSSGRLITSLVSPETRLCEVSYAGLQDAFSRHAPVLVDCRCSGAADKTYTIAIAPIFDPDNPTDEPIGGVLLFVNTDAILSPVIGSWPIPSKTGEALLLTSDGDKTLLVGGNTAGPTLHDLTFGDDSVEAAAVRMDEGVLEGIDHNDVPVFAYVGRVPDSSWYLVAKQDSAEALAPWQTEELLSLTLVAILLVGVIGGTLLLNQRARAAELEKTLQSEREQLRLREQLADVAATVPGALYSFVQTPSEGMSVTYASDAMPRVLGLKWDELQKDAGVFFSRVNPDDFVWMMGAIAESAETLEVWHGEFKYDHPDRGEIWLEGQALPRRLEDGSTVWHGIMRDITERRALQDELDQHRLRLEELVEARTFELASVNEELRTAADELEQMNEELIVANEAKESFLRSISHELRTPLNSIIGFSDIMRGGLAGDVTNEQQQQLEMINHSGRHLLLLINDILDLARVEAGKTKLVVETIDVVQLAQGVIDTVRPSAEAKQLALIVEVADPCPQLTSDSRRVEQILLNLLSNAVKFTNAGSVTLRVDTPSPGMVALHVCDTGSGVPEADLERVFSEFTQLGDSNVPREGTGLGLAIARGLAELLGGVLSVASVPGEGSTFTLVLPVVPDQVEVGG